MGKKQLGERVLSGEPGSETDHPFQWGDTSELRLRIEVSDYDDPFVVPANTGKKKKR